MLISSTEIIKMLEKHNILITGALHIGAHECEELSFYDQLGLTMDDVIWIEAIPNKVQEAKTRNIPNVFHSVITDKDDEIVTFKVANNGQSSSVLDFGTHSQEHPDIVFTDKIDLNTITIDTFFERNRIDETKCNFWNFDIQGAELMALKGGTKYIKSAKAIYLEVNEKELYKECALIGEIDIFLAQYNFKRVLTNMTYHSWGDALYIIQN
jgi:FkbM family methyltransferase